MKVKNMLMLPVLSIVIGCSVPVMAANPVTVTVIDNKNTKSTEDDTSYRITLDAGTKLTDYAIAKIKTWATNDTAGRSQTTRNAYSVILPVSLSGKIKKNTTVKLVYKQTKPIINFYDGVTNKVFLSKVVELNSKVTYPAKAPVHEGYIFTGWKGVRTDSAINKITTYKATANYKQSSYTLKFDGNGASNSNAMKPVKLTYSKKYKLPTCKFNYSGYEFVGWNINGHSYKPDDVVSGLAKDDATVKCFAVWQKSRNYTIDYNLNGGEWNKGASVKYEYTTSTNTFTLPTPKRSSYTFAGWTGTNLTVAKKSVSIKNGSTGNREYTATWKPNTYTISFNKNGGKGSMKSIKATYGEKVTIPECQFTFFRYNFLNWEDQNGNIFVPGVSYSNLTTKKSITLKAVWEMNPAMDSKLIIDANGGKYEGKGKLEVYNHEGEYMVLKTPVKSGYTFDGWKIIGDASLIGDNEVKFGKGDSTARAIWKKIMQPSNHK